jgi:DNA-binding response OmpR family regulator
MGEGAAHAVVLVVDDEPDHLMMLEILLESVGYEVVAVTSCASARHVLESRHVDVLVADLFLGDGTAMDILENAGVRRPMLAIVISGSDAAEDVERTLDAGYDAHLVKPTPIDMLREVIAAGLARHAIPSETNVKVRSSDTPLPHTKRSAG